MMATITHGHAPASSSTPGGWFSGLLSDFRRWRLERQTFAALSDLSDRELEDLGIKRWQLREVARRAVSNG
jgi:uncharacterized protein YjiS (DUF1127 family)